MLNQGEMGHCEMSHFFMNKPLVTMKGKIDNK